MHVANVKYFDAWGITIKFLFYFIQSINLLTTYSYITYDVDQLLIYVEVDTSTYIHQIWITRLAWS